MVAEEDPDLLVLQLLAADQLGHVRGVRSPEYLDQLAETDRHVGEFLEFLEESGRLDGATVILMADHGQGRGIGGHGHMDWGERPVPFVVWGEGALPGAVSHEPRSVLELAATISRLLGTREPEAARGRPLVPAEDPGCVRTYRRYTPATPDGPPSVPVVRPRPPAAASPSSSRATRRPPWAACSRGFRASRAACPWTCSWSTTARGTRRPRSGKRTTCACVRIRSRAGSAPPFAPGSRPRATRATAPRSTSTATASTTRPSWSGCSTRSRAVAPTTCSARASSAAARA